MKKSKFLKKSLATLLALMLVVAMIPVGASAETVGDGTIVSLTAEKGTLAGSGKAYTDTLPYTADKDTLTVVLDGRSGYDAIVYVVEEVETSVSAINDACAIANIGADTIVTFYAVDEAAYDADGLDTEEKSDAYTVEVVATPASDDTTVKEATIGEVNGVVDNTAKTITFVLPWSATSGQTADVVMNAVVLDADGKEVPVKVSGITIGADKTFSAVAQSGATQAYTIITSYTEGLKTLSIGGVAAVPATNADGEVIENKHVVTLPAGTDLEEELPLVFTSGTALSKAELGKLDEVKSGESYVFEEGEYELTLTNRDNDVCPTKDTILVQVAKSNDTKITAAEGATTTYTESGTINGKNISIVMPKDTDLENDVTVTLTAAVDSIVVAGTNKILTKNETIFSLDNQDFSKPVTLKVTAADKETVDYYTLTVTAAGSVTSEPAITSAKLVIGEDSYTAAIKDKTITFTVPYSTPADISSKSPSIIWGKTPATVATTLPADDFFANLYEGTHSVEVESDSGDKVTYTIVFEKGKAETGKTLKNLSVTTADNSDDVTAENTYKASISGTKITGKLPYALYNDDAQNLVAQFELPLGAKFYNTTGNKIYNELESGFDEETKAAKPNAVITVKDLKGDANPDNEQYFVVADETAAVLIDNASEVTIDALKKAPYKGHVTLYTLTVDSEQPSKEALLKSFTDEEKNITSSITATALKLTVPFSYDTVNGGAEFTPVYVASTGATVKANDTVITEETKFKITGEKLMLGDAEVNTITVESEAQVDSKPYATTKYQVSVTVSDAEKGALITALKANKTSAAISGKAINVTLPFGSDITAVTLDITASKMADVVVSVTPTTEDEINYYDLTDPVTIKVTSEDKKTVNNYTLTAKVAPQFSDVKEGTWYYDYVTEAAAAGIINGKGDGIFDPEGNITRGDFALMTVRMLGVDVSSYTSSPFSDVKAGSYYEKAIAYCADKGIIGGTGDGKFEPEKNILREEAAKIVAEAKELKDLSDEKFKDDAQISSWAKNYVSACKAAGIFGGDEKGNFNPKSPITRAETAKIMVVAMNLK